jgi:hypothetical protein
VSGSSILGTAIGLAFTYFLVALLCSAVTEWVANLARKRAKYLLRGLRDLLDAPSQASATPGRFGPTPPEMRADRKTEQAMYDRALKAGTTAELTVTEQRRDDPEVGSVTDITSWTDEVMAHPLVRSLKQSRAADGVCRNPSYLAGHTFATALVDILVPNAAGETSLTEIRDVVKTLPDDLPLKAALLSLLNSASADLAIFMTAVERWYDDAMARVSGSYKRWAKRWIIVVGVVVACMLQVDSVQIAQSLYTDGPLRDSVAAAATNGSLCGQGKDLQETRQCVASELTQLQASAGLPVGWGTDQRPQTVSGWVVKALGWALTAAAAAFGAPFWFQALSRLGSLRNTGTPPSPTGSGATS